MKRAVSACVVVAVLAAAAVIALLARDYSAYDELMGEIYE